MPELKDYYSILELKPSATLPEIKKAYRRLALEYHPDKNPDDQYALIRFSEIKEAYETLSSTGKKELYLQERWYRQSLGKTKFNDQLLTPPVILKQLLELDKHLSTVDQFRMNKNGLNRHLLELFSTENITRLKSFEEPLILQEIVAASLRVLKLLPQPLIEGMAARLISLCANEQALVERISQFVREQKAKNRWEKLTGLLIILVTITICLLIYFVSR